MGLPIPGRAGSIDSGGSAGGSSPGRPDIARTRSDVEITPIGSDSSLSATTTSRWTWCRSILRAATVRG